MSQMTIAVLDGSQRTVVAADSYRPDAEGISERLRIFSSSWSAESAVQVQHERSKASKEDEAWKNLPEFMRLLHDA